MTFIKKRHRRIKKTCAVQISNREEEPPVVSDLVAARWRAAIWSAELENKIIPRWHRHCLDRGLPIYVAFSVGKRAAEHLVKCHHATVLEIAGRRMRGRFRPHKKDGKEYNTELFDDFVATGMLALWESMLAFERNRGARLNTYARYDITGAIKDEAKAYYAGGIAGETRVQRLAYAYPRYSPEWIVALAKKRRIRCTLQDAEVALQQVSELGKRVHYSTIEGLSIQDDAEGRSPDGRYRCGDELIVGDYLTDGKARGKYSLFSKSQLSPQLLHHEGWRTERKYYQWPDYPRCGKSGVVDKLVRDSDSRDERRLKHIGPRAYAAELWLRDIKPIPRPEI